MNPLFRTRRTKHARTRSGRPVACCGLALALALAGPHAAFAAGASLTPPSSRFT